jgi:hypothetical protein
VSNYVKSTNFAVKDGLPSGDPLKVVKGTEIDTEFNNIATAVASKANISSPTFLGTPFAPTASAGTATNQIATTAFVSAALQAVYPVGSIYINAAVTTNPATLLGFGTWVEFGSGRVLVGQNTSDTAFDVLEETGGSKDAVVVAHTHTFSATTNTTGAHTHTQLHYQTNGSGDGPGPGASCCGGSVITSALATGSAGDHSHTVSGTTASTGSSGTNANLQPYIVVRMWKRTA